MWTLDEHVQCAKDTSAWFNRVNFYIDQMHDCKFEPKRQKKGKFKPLTEEADQLYCRALFYKKLGRSSFDVFPSSFKSPLPLIQVHSRRVYVQGARARRALYH